MKRLLMLQLFLFVCGCSDDTLRVLECESGTMKYCGDPALLKLNGVGACHAATKECVEGVWGECSDDDVYPMKETCNGLDDDCDGVNDFNILGTTLAPNDVIKECSTACGEGAQICLQGEWSICSAKEPSKEICNYIDDDCDGAIDNVDIEFCYSLGLDHPTLRHPESCGPGILQCMSNTLQCVGERLPNFEVCNDVDDNCDGQVNEGLANVVSYDIVMGLDESGSMQLTINKVKRAWQRFMTIFSEFAYRWALVGVPEANIDYQNTLLTNFVDTNTFSRILDLQTTGFAGNEPTLNAVYDICNIQENPLGLSWKQGSKKTVIIFADEEAQTIYDKEITEAQAAEMCANNNVTVYLFVKNNFRDGYDLIADQTGGKLFDIDVSENSLFEKLQTLIAGFCED